MLRSKLWYRTEVSIVDEVVDAVLASRRYRSVHPATVRRLAEAQRGAGIRAAELTKRTKRALHQIFGAYVPQPPHYDRWWAALQEVDTPAEHAAIVRRAMAEHASTRERLESLEAFCEALIDRVGRPRSVLDVACGLQPLASPWWGLEAGTPYYAWDIDQRLIAFVGRCLAKWGLRSEARVVDLLDAPAWPATEVALVLKTLPCLEQQCAGAGEALLEAIPARRVVVSFPTRSLSGRSKGMRQTYARGFEPRLSARGWEAECFEIGPELIYVVDRGVPWGA